MKFIKRILLGSLLVIASLVSMPKAEAKGYDAWSFYEWVKVKYPAQRTDAQKAIDILNQYANYHKRGDMRDSTSIQNMKKSIDLIKEGNKLMLSDNRKKNKKSWTISHQAMAIAMTSAATTEDDHTHNFNVWENLAWGYMDNNPYRAWYYGEKKALENGEKDRQKIGHYLNIIDENTQVTGLAISTLPKTHLGIIHSQIWGIKGQLGQDFSINNYESMLNTYIKEKNIKIDPDEKESDFSDQLSESGTSLHHLDDNHVTEKKQNIYYYKKIDLDALYYATK
ncbi:MAG: hypothetical protein PUG67_01960 [Peptoniphilaceae bacterium]|nr:hypothetical protein [Peptoniphilaceae bacterium]MDY6019193.1 hypothetical protein [Anaerococcus sp.]